MNEFANAARNALSFLVADRGFEEDSITLPNDANSVYATYAITYTRRECTSLPLFVRLSETPARENSIWNASLVPYTTESELATLENSSPLQCPVRH